MSFFAVTVKGVNKLQANNPAGSRSTRPTRESEVKFVINLFLFVAAKVGSPDYEPVTAIFHYQDNSITSQLQN